MLQDHTVSGWLIGLIGVSVILGSLFAYFLHKLLRSIFWSTVEKNKVDKHNKVDKNWDVSETELGLIPWQPIAIGISERIFVTGLIALDISGAAVAIMTWIALKMVAGWNRLSGAETWRRMATFNALLNNLASMSFAVLGGLIASGTIPFCIFYVDSRLIMQLVSIVMTLSGAIMVAFGYRVREGIEKTLRKELEIDKRKLVVPADVEKVPVLFYGGLLMIILAALVQLLLLA